jgi:hypothetical protein|tara:strand:+ start:3843 stop:4214 length:372 start_codon:yes stop_codon:yes gene_type:complete
MTNAELAEDSEAVSKMSAREAYEALLVDVNKSELEKVCKQLYLSLAAAAQAYMAFKAVMQPMDPDLSRVFRDGTDGIDYSDTEWIRFASNSYHTPDVDSGTVEKFMRFVSIAGLSISKVTGIK